ncbi:hypothetical protein QBC42DRAFT_99472 [Cladorrhinum samala]|uniref:Uncharacterized protein n=1 Tax=Cladorrhinum samala TaxID=585594 RepID=A0AAV9HLJ4_9PEZI|nr:hypothetical protein QBC42DRAFT_99472 [Cladorrhinum samala]
MTTQPQNSPGWARRRHITTTLASGEILTPLSLMTEDGHWVNMRNALISPYYNTSGISESAAAMMEYRQQELTGEEVRTFVTPLGTITNRRAVVLWFELSQLPLPPILMRLPLLERVGNLEVDMVLGLPFYTWYCQQRNPLEYVQGNMAINNQDWLVDGQDAMLHLPVDNGAVANWEMDMNNYA